MKATKNVFIIFSKVVVTIDSRSRTFSRLLQWTLLCGLYSVNLREENSDTKGHLAAHIIFFFHHSFSALSLKVIDEILDGDYQKNIINVLKGKKGVFRCILQLF